MRTPQLFCIIGAIVTATACNRAETDARKDKAAADLRTAARTAREKLADAWLVTKIQSQYFADADVKARFIHVSVRDSVVRLTGRVDSAAEHQEALQIARSTDGVVRVDDALTVTAASSAAASSPAPAQSATGGSTAASSPAELPDDAQITAGVQSRFFVDEQVKSRRIDVETRQGVVTLQGEVASEVERQRALLLAREATGVQRVEDHLTVDAAVGGGASAATGTSGSADPEASNAADAAAAPASGGIVNPLDDTTVVTKIQAKFFLDGAVKQGNIEVTSKDGVVLLQGTVPTEAAHQQALTIARTTEGVTQVVDRLGVQKKQRDF